MLKRLKAKLAQTTLTAVLGYAIFAFFIAGVATAGVLLTTKLMNNPLGTLQVKVSSTQEINTISVDGQATITTVPDEAQISVGISSLKSTVAAAQNQANQVITAITAGLKELGISEAHIKTSNYSVYPNYDWSGSVQRITGYTVNQDLDVTITDFDKLNQVIDLATSSGANQIGGISFNLSREKRAELEKKAREEAVADAKARAIALASSTGIKLGRIVNVWENSSGSFDYIPYRKMAGATMMNDGAVFAESEVSAGSTDFTYNISLTYELE